MLFLMSVRLPIDEPQCDARHLPWLRAVIPQIRDNVTERWGTVRSDAQPLYNLRVESTDIGLAFVYRRCDATPWSACPVRPYVWAAVRWALRAFRIGRQTEIDATMVRLTGETVHLACCSRTGYDVLGQIWERHGADMPGESATYTCSCGAEHAVLIAE
jgi:hypothetical protein